MEGTEGVSEKLCIARHANVVKTIDAFGERLESQEEESSDMKTAIMKLTTIQEIQLKNSELGNTAMSKVLETVEKIESRVELLENTHDTTTITTTTTETSPAILSFWETPTGTWVIKVMVALAAVVVLSAIAKDSVPGMIKFFMGD